MTTINKSQLLAILRYLNAPSNTYDWEQTYEPMYVMILSIPNADGKHF